MSHKKRRSEDSGKGQQGSQPRAADSPAPARRDGPLPTGRTARSLPAFGFAEDLLGGSVGAGSRGEAVDRDPPARPPPSNVPQSDVSEAAPDRVFAFADSLEQAARSGAQELAAPQVLSSWVTFDLAGEVFALPVEPVREVLRVTSITRVPHAPQPIRGVTNLRGRVIPVIDLRMRIDLEAKDLDRASRVIVVASRGRLLGLLVDAVHQVLHIDLNQVQAPPDDVMTVQSDYILGVYHRGDQLVLLLDVDRALVIKDPSPQPEEATS